METPILFIIFNRPEHSLKALNCIRKAKPKYLYIASDGPRNNRPGEDKLVAQTMQATLSCIDWDCQVKTLVREQNLGCGKAVSSAITWFFEHVEAGIILEDDCIPDPSFFDYCTELLSHYTDQVRVMHISGANYQMGKLRGDGSYYFSLIPHIWGWATWRRAWKHYKLNITDLEQFKAEHRDVLPLMPMKMLDLISSNQLDTWDAQWQYAIVKQGGLSITPNINMVQNIGFESGTHTTGKEPLFFRKFVYGAMEVIKHPTNMASDKSADTLTSRLFFRLSSENIWSNLVARIQRFSSRITK
jgi:hypothetical protein